MRSIRAARPIASPISVTVRISGSSATTIRSFIGPRSARRMPGRDRLGQHPAGADPHDGQRPEFHLVRRSGFPPRAVGGHRRDGPARGEVAAGETLQPRTDASGIPIPMRYRGGCGRTRSWRCCGSTGVSGSTSSPPARPFTIPADSDTDARGDLHRSAAAGRRDFRRGVCAAPGGLYELV